MRRLEYCICCLGHGSVPYTTLEHFCLAGRSSLWAFAQGCIIYHAPSVKMILHNSFWCHSTIEMIGRRVSAGSPCMPASTCKPTGFLLIWYYKQMAKKAK